MMNLLALALALYVFTAHVSADNAWASTENCTWVFIEQPLSHFARRNVGTFKQRLCVNRDFWTPDTKSPVFLYTGNESPVEEYVNNTGLMWNLAKKHSAMIVFAEHRFFGESIPSVTGMSQCISFLSSQEALADYAALVNRMRRNWGAADSAVIAFGGSYGGMLASWMRMKYPNAIDGAIAASAPILGFPLDGCPEDSSAQVVTYAASADAGAAPRCADNLKSGYVLISHLANKSREYRKLLSQAMNLCTPLETPSDAQALLSYLQEPLFDLSEGSYPFPSDYITFALTGSTQPLPPWAMQVMCEPLGASFGAEISGAPEEVRFTVNMQQGVAIHVDWDVTTDNDFTEEQLMASQALKLASAVAQSVQVWYNVSGASPSCIEWSSSSASSSASADANAVADAVKDADKTNDNADVEARVKSSASVASGSTLNSGGPWEEGSDGGIFSSLWSSFSSLFKAAVPKNIPRGRTIPSSSSSASTSTRKLSRSPRHGRTSRSLSRPPSPSATHTGTSPSHTPRTVAAVDSRSRAAFGPSALAERALRGEKLRRTSLHVGKKDNTIATPMNNNNNEMPAATGRSSVEKADSVVSSWSMNERRSEKMSETEPYEDICTADASDIDAGTGWNALVCNEGVNLVNWWVQGVGNDLYWPPNQPRNYSFASLVPGSLAFCAYLQQEMGLPGAPRVGDDWSNWIDSAYGGERGLEYATNIVFSNGNLDPWSSAGVLPSGVLYYLDSLRPRRKGKAQADVSSRSAVVESAIISDEDRSVGAATPSAAAETILATSTPKPENAKISGIIGERIYRSRSSGGASRSSNLGVYSSSVISVVIDMGGHHLDLFWPTENDPESVRLAREIEEEKILEWIAQRR